MKKYNEALLFAAKKHQGHKRNNGDNYIIHPIRVSQEVFTEDQKIIALLHDTLEDTGTTYEELKETFGTDIAESVEALTHRKNESYADYIQRVKKNPNAIQVKLSDIADNLNDSPSENAMVKGALGISELVS